MTEELFATDAYRRSFDAAVVATDREVGRVAPGRTAFYPGGGGQPREITTSNLYVRPDGQELARLADALTDGTLEVEPEVLPLQDGGAALTRVLAGRTRGRKLVLRP